MRAAVVVLLVMASPAWAEVADKVPSTVNYLGWALCFNALAFAWCRSRWWLGVVVAAWCAFVGSVVGPLVMAVLARLRTARRAAAPRA